MAQENNRKVKICAAFLLIERCAHTKHTAEGENFHQTPCVMSQKNNPSAEKMMQ